MASASKSIRKRQQQKQRIPMWGWIAMAAALILLIAGAFWFSQPQTTAALPAEITVAEAVARQEAGAFLLDVRQPEEWIEAHISGTTLIPLDQLSARLSELPQDQEIVVVCRSGNRSAQGRDILLGAGFKQVTSMAGGLTEWKAAGYPTVSGP